MVDGEMASIGRAFDPRYISKNKYSCWSQDCIEEERCQKPSTELLINYNLSEVILGGSRCNERKKCLTWPISARMLGIKKFIVSWSMGFSGRCS